MSGIQAIRLTEEMGFVASPRSVGGYDMGGMRFMLTRRPSWIARLFCRWLLDWRWTDTGG